MNKTKISFFMLVLAFLMLSTGAWAAKEISSSDDVSENGREIKNSHPLIDNRVIAYTNSGIKKMGYKAMGCKVVRELSDATAMKCPGAVISLFNLEPDRLFQITDLEADRQINADDVWLQNVNGSDVNVAILDTGIDLDHPELMDSFKGGFDYINDGNDSLEDWHGHGTHVAGIISANGDDGNAKGVAPGAGFYMYQVCYTDGCWNSDMAAAMDAAILQKQTDPSLKVMSISIGGGNFLGDNCDDDYLAQKVNAVAEAGIAVVVASGNDRFFVSSPACASGAIAVGAVDKADYMADFSNFGPSLDIVAPGVNIYSAMTDANYAYMTGTSMATPHVSGVLALMFQNDPGLTLEDAKKALYGSAREIASDSVCYGVTKIMRGRYFIGKVPCSSDNYGAGIVDAYGAVNFYAPTVECSSDLDCNDNIDCTIDVCMESGTTDSYCQFTEDNCGLESFCGDGTCDGRALGEDCYTCSLDCGDPAGRGVCCGDGKCDTRKGEICVADCGA